MTSTRRAPAMAPADRRKAIIEATLPLLGRFGAAVTTRQIADAAGIAEGTIFRAFPDKETLLKEALHTAFDPELSLRELDRIDPDLPLEARVLAVVKVGQARLESIFTLITKMGIPPPTPPPREERTHRIHGGDAVDAKVAAILEPDAAVFRYDLPFAVKALRLLMFAATHPRITSDEPMSAEQIVDLFLHGSLTPPPPPPGASSC